MAITIDDIARKTGFHRTTVSKVLSGDKRCYASAKTRDLILATARDLRFVPNYFARSLQQKCSHSIGVAGRLDLTGVTGPTLKAIVDGLLEKNYMPLFYDASRPEGEALVFQELRSRGVDGVILNSVGHDAELAKIFPSKIPMVLIRCVKLDGCPCVIEERFNAFVRGVQWLAKRGHRHIAFIGTGNVSVLTDEHHRFNTHRLKIEGYCEAMRSLGRYDEKLLLECGPMPGDARRFVAGQGELFRKITAILAANDRLAVEVMSGLSDLGLRVPEDCSVIGFDDTDFAQAVKPRLTSFNPRREEVGAKAAEMIFKLIDGCKVKSVTIAPELIERESAGPCRT
ncbi:MAG: LacI family DNA-binding transcriptional regulator [Kiritimatiellia bacterium]